ncbi:MAG: hypothetical protein K8T20_03525 [Planctomycetes bacterium]|nr:hypothetical protein [Planctomycetota bacterium]
MTVTITPDGRGARPGPWKHGDCDLQVLAHVPSELGFAVVAATLVRHRDELAASLVAAGGSEAAVQAVRDAVPDLSHVAARLREPRPERRPRGRSITRLTWALRRALVFLESWAPPLCSDDPVLEDRAFNLLSKIVFLLDILDSWRSPRIAAVSEAARKTG